MLTGTTRVLQDALEVKISHEVLVLRGRVVVELARGVTQRLAASYMIPHEPVLLFDVQIYSSILLI